MRQVTMAVLCLLSAIGLCTGSLASVASASNGAAAWGANTEGQLGDGTTLDSDLPEAVSGLSEVIAVSAGGSHVLALLSNGTVMAWGANAKGQLGDGTTTSSDVPVAVSGLSGVTAISAGGTHSLALLGNGTVMAWGENNHGELGDGTIANSDVPVAVSGLSGVSAISAGDDYSLALLSNHTVMAWGDDAVGQLGNGTTNNGELLPVAVKELTGATAISAGGSHGLALLEGGTAMAWGSNTDGQLGNGTTTNSDVPVAVSGLTGASAVSAGTSHSLALLGNGTAEAWGDNVRGALGNGTTTNSDVPVAVSGLTGATAISAGGFFSVALLSNHTAMAWGGNLNGQLGNGTTTDSDVPVAVTNIDEIAGIDASSNDTVSFGAPLASVSSISPTAGPPSGKTTVTITGTNFTGATAVKFGPNAATGVIVNSPTSITAESPAGSGVASVTVTTAAGTSGPLPANAFSYLPVVTGVSPASGPQGGGTEVTITGSDLLGATAVKFGTSNAERFVVNSESSITAISPSGSGIVDVTVTTAGGTSATSTADHFGYAEAAPEFGRCIAGKTGTGLFSSSTCTAEGGEKKYEWVPGPPPKAKFTTKSKLDTTASVETIHGNKLTCNSEKSVGEYTGAKTVGGVVFTFAGCSFGGAKCSSTGAKEGEIVTTTLVGELGVIKVSTEGALHNQIGLDTKAPGGTIAEFTCGSIGGAWRGSVIVPVTTNKMVSGVELKYLGKAGKQTPEAFEGGAKDVLESSLGTAFEQAGLTITTKLTDAERVEVNSVF